MKKALMSVMALSAILIALFVAMPLAPAADKLNRILEIPFPGVMLVYTEQEIGVVSQPRGKAKETDVRTVTFLPSREQGRVWIRDSFDPEEIVYRIDFFEVEIDMSTRKIVYPSGLDYYFQSLIPTNIRVNDVIPIGLPGLTPPSGIPLRVVGTQKISVMGKEVEAWVLEGRTPQYTDIYFYGKSTGILLSGAVSWFNQDGTAWLTWGILLTDTNAQIG